MDRREFIKSVGATAAVAGACCPAPGDDLREAVIPDDKGYTPEMLAALRDRGRRRVYAGDRRFSLGMPVGGVCAGQLYVLGDGTLGGWHVDGRLNPTGHGSVSYRPRKPVRELEQGLSITLDGGEGKPVELAEPDRGGTLDMIEFIGEYPIAEISYRSLWADMTWTPTLRVYSPFCPLAAKDSALPCTVLRLAIRNHSSRPLSGWVRARLENGVERAGPGEVRAVRRNRVVREPGLTGVLMDALPTAARADARPAKLIDDFEGDVYAGWRVEGEAFGSKPSRGTEPDQNPVTGFAGRGVVNSFRGGSGVGEGDRPTGKMTSEPFALDRDYMTFLIGGGGHAGRTCLSLVVDGKTVRTATGRNSERLEPAVWDVRDLAGKQAHIEIIDNASGGWGHVNVDRIMLVDDLPADMKRPRPDSESNGTMALAFLGDGRAGADREGPSRAAASGPPDGPDTSQGDESAPVGVVHAPFTIAPDSSIELVFVITWHFPILHTGQGQMYTNWFKDAWEVARYARDNDNRLYEQTELFRKTYYEDTTLPWWLALRLMMPTANLATGTAQWWKNGRFWGWEGVGCCHGTCTHVWNYSHAEARLFPELARSTRVMQDLGTAFEEATGRVAFRGEVDKGFAYAGDGQAGTVLKCYREHLTSPDDSFLKTNWPRIRKALEFAIAKDLEKQSLAEPDGVIEGSQHNTFDIDFHGPNTFVGSLYIAALLAGARMATAMGDQDAATRYRAIGERGRAWTEANLYNGAYFTQRLAQDQDTRFQYGDGCLTDQLFGQTWARLLDLGTLYDPAKVGSGLRAVYRYNFAPPGGSLGVYNTQWPAEREFASAREGGVLICTWPRGGRPGEPVRYRDEVWTGCEYQVAAGMVAEELVDEALVIVKAIDDRYDGALHNPWNEVECGDHYARAMASWGVYQALGGFIYDGPAGIIGLAPRLTPERFAAFFAGAEGWGLISQARDGGTQTNTVEVRWGRLRVARFVAATPTTPRQAEVTAAGRRVPAQLHTDPDGRAVCALDRPVVLEAGQSLTVTYR